MKTVPITFLTTVLWTIPAALVQGQLQINIIPGSGLSANSAALTAFDAAATEWSARISSPITININADLAPLPTNVIGSTNSVDLYGGYTEIRDALVATAAGDPTRVVVGYLPTESQLALTLPSGVTFGTVSGGNLLQMFATKANLKAMGFTGLDAIAGTTSDGSITFSSNFNFSYNHASPSPLAMDFQTVAAHEIGHVLGFVSDVDSLDQGATTALLAPLDLYRFADVAGQKPTTLSDFTTLPRNLVPGQDAVTSTVLPWGSLTQTEFAMSTGVTQGDGHQASHWKDDGLTGSFIGIMDPTLDYGQTWDVGEADLRAMSLIGYDVQPVPEPTTWAMLGGLVACGSTILWWRRRRVKKETTEPQEKPGTGAAVCTPSPPSTSKSRRWVRRTRLQSATPAPEASHPIALGTKLHVPRARRGNRS